jgi:hypothetical protein
LQVGGGVIIPSLGAGERQKQALLP